MLQGIAKPTARGVNFVEGMPIAGKIKSFSAPRETRVRMSFSQLETLGSLLRPQTGSQVDLVVSLSTRESIFPTGHLWTEWFWRIPRLLISLTQFCWVLGGGREPMHHMAKILKIGSCWPGCSYPFSWQTLIFCRVVLRFGAGPVSLSVFFKARQMIRSSVPPCEQVFACFPTIGSSFGSFALLRWLTEPTSPGKWLSFQSWSHLRVPGL